jgi:hypothetical protein
MTISKTPQLSLATISRSSSKMSAIMFILFVLCPEGYGSAVPVRITPRDQKEARLIKRYEQPASYNRIVEDTVEIRLEPASSKRRLVAIRVCSHQPLLSALFRSAIDPFETAKYLTDYYAYSSDRIFLLRSDQCLSSIQGRAAPAEIWIAASEDALPHRVESLRFDQITLRALGRQPTNRGVRDYLPAVQTLIETLRSSPDSTGAIIGYYLEHPNPLLRKRVLKAARLAKVSGIPPARYHALLRRWHGGDSSYPASEPRYPNVLLIEIKRLGKQ